MVLPMSINVEIVIIFVCVGLRAIIELLDR
jgi:hypothetical protein